MPDELLALAARCEAAARADRDIDLAIWRLIDPVALQLESEGRTPLPWLHCYTSSIDRALTLVPPDMGASVCRHGKRNDDCSAYVGISDSDARGNFMTDTSTGDAKTMALAVCAAALKAIAKRLHPPTTKGCKKSARAKAKATSA